MKYRKLRVIISGGGTGGHIFPAVSIADKLREVNPETEILFVGAEGRMEMEKVPAAGYRIVGLPMAGLQRRLTPANIINDLKLPFKLLSSLRKAGKIIDGFRPDVAIGVGGYASAPLLWQATRKKIPALIQEQNGFAGMTNKILARRVGSICVAYEGMEKFFPADKICLSGNPIRSEIHPYTEEDRRGGLDFYGMDPARKHIFVVGGSLGSGTLNEAMKAWIAEGCPGGGRGGALAVREILQGRGGRVHEGTWRRPCTPHRLHRQDGPRIRHGRRGGEPLGGFFRVGDMRRGQARHLRTLP